MMDLLSDTLFREQAVRALEAFQQQHDLVIKRSQIEGLRQIAVNEPGKVLEFAKHQRTRAEDRNKQRHSPKLDQEIAFWKLVEDICGTTTTSPVTWSLMKFAQETAPEGCQVSRPHGSAPAEQHKAYREAKERARLWGDRRIAEDYPAFFQRFCAHYLYLVATRGNQPVRRWPDGEDEEDS
jgi:hypothetical protein